MDNRVVDCIKSVVGFMYRTLVYSYLHIYNSNNTVLKCWKILCVKGIDNTDKILVNPKGQNYCPEDFYVFCFLDNWFLRFLAKKKRFLRHANSATWDSIMWSTHISDSFADFLLLFNNLYTKKIQWGHFDILHGFLAPSSVLNVKLVKYIILQINRGLKSIK